MKASAACEIEATIIDHEKVQVTADAGIPIVDLGFMNVSIEILASEGPNIKITGPESYDMMRLLPSLQNDLEAAVLAELTNDIEKGE